MIGIVPGSLHPIGVRLAVTCLMPMVYATAAIGDSSRTGSNGG